MIPEIILHGRSHPLQRRRYTAADLRAMGMTPADIARALRTGHLVRPRRGVYLQADATPAEITAAAYGGKVTGPTMWAALGAWDTHAGTHVSLPAWHRAPGRPGPVARVHWTGTPGRDLYEDLEISLAHLADSDSVAHAVAVIDSILHRGLAPKDLVDDALALARRGARVRRLVDASAESGSETLVRLWLHRHQIRFRPQVEIGRFRVDFLVGTSLVLEVIGREYHGTRDSFEADAEREAYLQSLGFLVFRITAVQATDMSQVRPYLLQIIRDGRHRRGRTGPR